MSANITHALVVQPVLCGAAGSGGGGSGTNAPGLYQGIGKIQFVKTSYDSLLGQFWQPVTNTYTQTLIFNSKAVVQTYQRVVTTPDFQFSAADIAGGPADYPPGASIYARNVTFNDTAAVAGLAGPGTIETPTVITIDKVGNIFFNSYLGNEASGASILAYGSFDGSTNAPVVYPSGTDLDNLANQVLVRLTPTTLPVGTHGVFYPTTTFAATGGAFAPPFTWSVSAGALPAGLTLSPGGTISGKPTQIGTFDFTLKLTDSLSRTVTWNLAITIN